MKFYTIILLSFGESKIRPQFKKLLILIFGLLLMVFQITNCTLIDMATSEDNTQNPTTTNGTVSEEKKSEEDKKTEEATGEEKPKGFSKGKINLEFKGGQGMNSNVNNSLDPFVRGYAGLGSFSGDGLVGSISYIHLGLGGGIRYYFTNWLFAIAEINTNRNYSACFFTIENIGRKSSWFYSHFSKKADFID